ncbi:MAG: DUF4328 domain-containing protein [Acidimicrobiia bacterium]|nr:DUF4328 domain-containing protein [Acidimicrobiia bacterium]
MTFGSHPPGWYPDPWTAGGFRWWDGIQWTPAAQPPGGTIRDLVADLERWGRIARYAVLAAALGYVVTMWASMVVMSEFSSMFGFWIGDPVDEPGEAFFDSFAAMAGPSTTFQVANLVSNLGWAVTLAGGVLFIVWFHKAAKLAVVLGLPARFTPGWAIGGFLIPVANFFLPYMSAVDMVPPDSPVRRTMPWWWAAWLAMAFFPWVMFGFVLWGSPFEWWVLGVYLVIVGLAAEGARRVVEGVVDTHRRIAEGWVGVTPR